MRGGCENTQGGVEVVEVFSQLLGVNSVLLDNPDKAKKMFCF